MKLEGIASSVMVADSGSLSEAARRLRVSRSVVSERLAELERTLGTPLLRRSTRKLSVTEDTWGWRSIPCWRAIPASA